jgi:type IV secretory pathway VirB10-like protein
MKKTVDIIARLPIVPEKGLPIRGVCNGIVMETDTILKAICSKATVHEILEDGTRLLLDLANYNKDNNAAIKAASEEAAQKAAEAEASKKAAEQKAAQEEAARIAAEQRAAQAEASKKIAEQKAAEETARKQQQQKSQQQQPVAEEKK